MNIRFGRRCAAIAAAMSAGVATTQAAAHETEARHADSHVHGVAEIEAALEGDQLFVLARAPMMSVAGFEHEPRSDAERGAIDSAAAALGDARRIVSPAEAGACRIAAAHVEAPYRDYDGDAHVFEALGVLDPSTDDHGHGDDHNHGDDHAHDDDHDHGAHKDFVAYYLFECGRPERIDELKIDAFSLFEALEKVDATFVGPQGQTFEALTPSNTTLRIK